MRLVVTSSFESKIMYVTILGLDLAKSASQVHGVDAAGHAVLKRRVLSIGAGSGPLIGWQKDPFAARAGGRRRRRFQVALAARAGGCPGLRRGS